MAGSEVHAQVATRVLRDLDREIRKVIAKDSKGIGADLVAAIRADRGVAPYGRVYAKLGSAAKVRTRAGRPPEVVVGGSRRFSGGGTINQLARAYEYGAASGDTRRGPAGGRARSDRRGRRKRPYPQFPPKSNEGLWVNKVCERWEKGPLLDEWLTLVDKALERAV
jgi:hypothetical protein